MRPTVPATLLRVLGAVGLVATLGAGSVATAATPAASVHATPAASIHASAPAASVGSIRITRTAVNARGHPTVASEALFVVSPRTTVRVYRVATDSAHRPWYLVHVQSRPGWIAGWLTDAVPVRTAGAWTAVMASSFGVGDGLVGARMACGNQLTTTVMAVAHRTLPCGTQVRIRIGTRTVVAKVMDRGPFTSGRTFDLAPAVCRALASCDGVFRIEWQRVP